jgi:hypothetical protein
VRAVEIFIIGGLIALVLTVGWNARDWVRRQVSRDAVSSSAVASGINGVSADKTEPKKARTRDRRVPDTDEQTSGASQIALPNPMAPKAELPRTARLFPTRNDLHVGATDAQIRDHFGEPTARVTEMRGGRVFEQYYYFNRDRTQLTVATLKAGVLVSAQSTVPRNYEVGSAQP